MTTGLFHITHEHVSQPRPEFREQQTRESKHGVKLKRFREAYGTKYSRVDKVKFVEGSL